MSDALRDQLVESIVSAETQEELDLIRAKLEALDEVAS